MTKATHSQIEGELRERFDVLMLALQSRELKSATEGIRRGAWINPHMLCATTGEVLELRLAVDDFKAILAVVRGLK